METTLARFIAALRNAEVRISTAETLDAFAAMDLVGYQDRALMKRSLSLVLPKTAEEKAAFDHCFDEFFRFEELASTAAGNPQGAQAEREGDPQSNAGDGAGGGDGNGERPPEPADAQAAQRGQRPRSKPGKDRMDAPAESAEDAEPLPPGPMHAPESPLGQQLMSGNRTELTMAMAQAGDAVELQNIQVFTQKGLYTRRIMEQMGLAELDAEIMAGEAARALPRRRLAQALTERRDWLREQVRDYVERQFLLHADASGKRLREELLRKVKLSNVEQRNFRLIQDVVLKMAKRLATLHSRRKKVHRRGQLNLPRTLRRNMAYDGAIFDLHWKSVKIDRPKVFAICDVSGSVANYSRFMLMFLYSLEAVMPKVRSFAFSSDLAEVTTLFEQHDLEDAIARTLRDYAGGSTDYGQALSDFERLCLDDIDNRTTIIILGDGRNNYGDARADILKTLYERCKRLIWLNPEARNAWTLGDAEMRRYGPYCHQVEECNSLMHLERVVGNLLKTVQ
ncbi:MAG: VWA domain-containing protein [Pseudomonadota bacterium]